MKLEVETIHHVGLVVKDRGGSQAVPVRGARSGAGAEPALVQARCEERDRLFLAGEFPSYGSVEPNGSLPVTIHLYVTDADATFNRAAEAGATVTMSLKNAFWGDCYGKLIDPYGHHWSIAERRASGGPDP